jgi:hypothetical protein
MIRIDLVRIFGERQDPMPPVLKTYTLQVLGTPRAPDIDVSPPSIDFGAVAVGTTATRQLTIRNVGQGDLFVSSILIQGGTASPFHFGGRIFTGFTVRPGQAVTIGVFFTPRTTGFFQDAVVIRSNDPDEATVTVPLSGRTPIQPLRAQITADRGCLEKGQNPVYFVGDPITVQFRVDGVEQALATIEDILPDGQVRVLFRQVVPGNRTLQLSGKIEPPLGRETLRLTAQAGEQIAQDQCSFTVQTDKPDLLFFVNIDDAPLQVVTSEGVVRPSSLSGQILIRIQDIRAEILWGTLYLESVPVSQGETGPITILLEGKGIGDSGGASLSQDTISFRTAFQGEMAYPMIDRMLGVKEFEDYTESFTEGIFGSLEYSGRFDQQSLQFRGSMSIDFRIIRPLLSVITKGTVANFNISLPFEPFLLFNTNPWEICIEIVFEKKEDKDAWKDDEVDRMIDEANQIWSKCGIQVRTKLRQNEKCIRVTLKKEFKTGGGGFCQGVGQGKNSAITIGHNVVEDCKEKNRETTYGRALAHELGHSLGLNQAKGTGRLMDDCGPSEKLDDKECETARRKATKLTTPEGMAAAAARLGLDVPVEVTSKEFTFTNKTGQDATDLHVEFNSNVWVKQKEAFKDVAGEGTRQIDFGRGKVEKDKSIKITFAGIGAEPKIVKCFWTKDGKNIGNCSVK